jgi:excisionase family DNA binding protein
MDAEPRKILMPGEVAALFRVDPKTITRWAMDGKLPHFRTLGNQRRFYEDEMQAILEENRRPRTAP